MLKKIILGIVITAVLSVTAFGAVYAYQKEKDRVDKVSAGQDDIGQNGKEGNSLKSGGGNAGQGNGKGGSN